MSKAPGASPGLFSSVNTPRHCEERSDEAIHRAREPKMDCFAPLAMTSFKNEKRESLQALPFSSRGGRS